jgi:uncharacterized membrane protein
VLRNTGASVWVRTWVGSHEEEGVSELAVVVVDKSGVVRRLYAGGTDFSDGREAQADDAMLGFIGALVLRVRGAGTQGAWRRRMVRDRGERPAMEEYLVTAVGYLRLVVEAIGAAVVGFGVFATTYRYVLTLVGLREYSNNEIRLYLGRYLALGLEFQLGADILSTAVAPSLDDVILLGAIAAIRTALNFFLSQELARERREVGAVPGAGRVADRDVDRGAAPG